MDAYYDLAIIGGGPAGLSAAINGVIRGCSVMVLDSGASLLAKAEKIDNYLGMPGASGFEMIAEFVAHALSLGVIIEKGKATSILPMGNSCAVSYGSQIITAKAVVLATGVVRDKAFPGEESYLGKGVSYCATCDGALYKGRKVVVYGMAKDAPDEANYLQEIGAQVVYLSPGSRPEGLKPDIAWHGGTIHEIRGTDALNEVVIGQEGKVEKTIEAEGLFILREAIAPQSLISGIQLSDGYIAVDRMGQTSIPGVYACGDCTGLPLQIAKAVGDGLIAGQEAARYASNW